MLLIVGPQVDARVDPLKVHGDLGAVPVHALAAAGHPAVDGLLAPGGVVGEVLPLVDRGRHVADLVVAPELRTVWDGQSTNT